MIFVDLLSRRELRNLGLSEDDTTIMLDHRVRHGGLKSSSELPETLSTAGARRLTELIENRPEVDGRLNELQLGIIPIPLMLSQTALTIEFHFNLRSDNSEYSVKLPFSLRGANSYRLFDISFNHLVELKVNDADDKNLHTRVFSPDLNPRRLEGDLSSGWTAFPELGEQEKWVPDGPTIQALLYVATTRSGSTVALSEIEDFRLIRAGRFQVISNAEQRFDTYRMTVMPVKSADLEDIQSLLGLMENGAGTRARMLDEDDLSVAEKLSRFRLFPAELDFEGSFSFEKQLPDNDGYIGWIWLLAGPRLILGLQADNRITVPVLDVVIVLPTLELSESAEGIPYDVSEQALLNRPDVFADDPGTSCKPFSNPGRILGEKRFHTVLRVTQPLVDKAGLGTINFDEQGERPVEYPRKPLSAGNSIDYDGKRTENQARTASIGHILEFSVRYRSNGYSLGDVAYSMTLAPRQTRRIVKIDFQRQERAQRRELTASDDEVSDTVLQDRDYSNEVESSLNEWSKGSSKASTSAIAAGAGFAAPGFVIGGGAVHGRASSSAQQSGGREAAASETQQLTDAIRRYGQSLRTLQSTVVTEAEQSESVEGVSEVVRNINYCHSLSVIYYEILRHQRVDTELTGVRECIFVPMTIKDFSDERLLRHRQVLRRYARGWIERDVFEHIEDIQRNFSPSEIPAGTRGSHPLTRLRGSIYLKMGIEVPTEGEDFTELNEATDQEKYERKRINDYIRVFGPFGSLLPTAINIVVKKLVRASDAERERYFQNDIAPHMAREYLNGLQLFRDNENEPMPADFTLASTYRYGKTLRVDFTCETGGSLSRNQLSTLNLHGPDGNDNGLPVRSYINVVSATLNYATDYYSNSARSDTGTRDILDSSTGKPDTNGAQLLFDTDSRDEFNYRKRLKDGYEELKKKLEENTFRYHKAIWWSLDRDELFTLLDGVSIDESHGRSIASLVERRPIGILGNSMVFRASTDKPVDPMFESFKDLIDHYRAGLTPATPIRVSLPTDGLYARAHMDECDACEEHSGSTDWVFNETDPALAELPAELLTSRRSEPQNLSPTNFPDTIINLQNAPGMPAPSGLSGALDAVSSGDAFRDITGLAGNQANALGAAKLAAGLATSFGQGALASHIAGLEADRNAGKDMKAFADGLDTMEKKGAISKDEKKKAGEAFAKRKANPEAKKDDEFPKSTVDKMIDENRSGSVTDSDGQSSKTVVLNDDKEREPNPQTDVYVIPIDSQRVLFLNFDIGQFALKGQHKEALKIIGSQYIGPATLARIEGHASTSGTVERNKELSSDRASQLLEELRGHAWPYMEDKINDPELLSFVGESGDLRRKFSDVQRIQDIPGAGHRHDPVERSVLFTFTHDVSLQLTWKVVTFFGIKFRYVGRYLEVFDLRIINTTNTEVRVVNTDNSEVVNETNSLEEVSISGTANNNNVVLKGNQNAVNSNNTTTFSLFSGIDISIGDITVQKDAEGNIVDVRASNPETSDWRLTFNAPDMPVSTSLDSVISDLARLIVDFGLPAASAGGTLLVNLQGMLGQAPADPESSIADEISDFIVQKVGSTVAIFLKSIKFGDIKAKVVIKPKDSDTAQTVGVISGFGITIGTGNTDPSAVIVANAAYATAAPRTLESWDDEPSLVEFAYLENPIASSTITVTSALKLIIDELLDVVPGNTPGNTVARLFDLMKYVSDLPAVSSGLHFKAFDGDQKKRFDASASALALNVFAIERGKVRFTKTA